MIGGAIRGGARRVVISRRLRGVVDFTMALGVWAGLVAVAAASYGMYIERAHVAEALAQAGVIKQEIGVRRAESGKWPAEIPFPLTQVENPRRPSPQIEVEEGAFTFVFRAGHRVSFRAAVSTASPRAPIVWLCGYASAPPDHRVAAVNRTDIPMLYLPAACRG